MSSVPRRYAKAIFEIGLEDGSLDRVQSELDALLGALAASDELRGLLASPVASKRMRKEVFGAVAEKLGTSTEVANLVRLLIERNRMAAFGDMVRIVRDLIDAERGQVRGSVLTARALTDDQLQAIQNKLGKVTGKTVLLEVEERPSLIGGIVARVGNTVFDGSVRTRLEALERSMTEGGA